MPNAFDRGAEFLRTGLKKHYSAPVIYRQDAAALPCAATPCSVSADDLEQDDWHTNARRMDFIFDVSEMGLDPEEGDTVEYNGEFYEVKRQAYEGAWRWTDTSHKLRRVHTQLLGATP